MVKIGQKRIWNDGVKFEVIEEKTDDMWIIKYGNHRRDVHEGKIIEGSSKIINM